MMRVLVACEESQAVMSAFRSLGHDAYSCDIKPCSGLFPEFHILGDALVEAYSGNYDLMIAHPPCTFLSNAGARHLYPSGVLNHDRFLLGLDAADFFLKLLHAPIPKIAVENPLPSKIFNLPQQDQVIQPYQFGHPYKKRTLLWLKGLRPLVPSNVLQHDVQSTRIAGNWFNSGGKERQANRSKTFAGIAKAMAIQWG